MEENKEKKKSFVIKNRDDFEKIKALKEAYVKARDEKDKAHDAFWGAIHDALPETDKDEIYVIDTSNEDDGIYIVNNKKQPSEAIGSVLEARIASK